MLTCNTLDHKQLQEKYASLHAAARLDGTPVSHAKHHIKPNDLLRSNSHPHPNRVSSVMNYRLPELGRLFVMLDVRKVTHCLQDVSSEAEETSEGSSAESEDLVGT